MGRSADDSKSKGAVLDLARARGQRRFKDTAARVRSLLENNRRTLNRLFVTNLLYTRQGTRAGRELLLAHQNLLRVAEVIRRAETAAGSGKAASDVRGMFDELESLLQRTEEITSRTSDLLGAIRRNDS